MWLCKNANRVIIDRSLTENSFRILPKSQKLNRTNLINSKTIFVSTLIVIPTLTLIIYLTGINEHRSLYLNSIFSTTILSVVFVLFITTGLYKGWKLKDTLGNFLDKFDRLKKPGTDISNTSDYNLEFIEADGLEGGLFSILAWIIIALLGTIILWTLGAIFWAVILVITGFLYWIIFRAYRLIFKNSPKCKNNFWKSLGIGIAFTILYNCWIYAIIFAVHFLDR